MKVNAPKLSAPSVFALLSSLGALARPSARSAFDREVKENAKTHVGAHLAELRKITPRRFLELDSGSAAQINVPARDEVDALLSALETLSRPGSSAEAQSVALGKLTDYFDAMLEAQPKKTAETASAATSLNAEIRSLRTRVERAERASESIRASQVRAARPVVDPVVAMIERAGRSTMSGMKPGKQ